MLERMLSRIAVRSRFAHISPPTPGKPAVRLPLLLSIRAYATPGRPKSVVGEPSRPVKRAVKKAASKPNDGSSAAEEKIARKARSPATKKTKAVTPEQAAKEKEAAAGKKERAALRKAAKQKKTKIQDLKVAALPDAPKKSGFVSAYQAYWSEVSKGKTITKATPISSLIKEAAAKWKEKTPAEIEHYNHLQHKSSEAAAAEYKRWIESHSADEIRLANLARAQLRREFPNQKSKWVELQDERRPKRPQSPYMSFSTERQNSGDFTNIGFAERAKLISQEWKALNATEKEKYEQLYKQDKERYHEEHSRAYGFPPAPPAAETTTAAA